MGRVWRGVGMLGGRGAGGEVMIGPGDVRCALSGVYRDL